MINDTHRRIYEYIQIHILGENVNQDYICVYPTLKIYTSVYTFKVRCLFCILYITCILEDFVSDIYTNVYTFV